MNKNPEKKQLADLRVSYTKASLGIHDSDPDPFVQFKHWLDEAITAQLLEPNAMSLATVSENGHPSVRTVLLKELSAEGFIFYTNYESRKSAEISDNPNVSLCFLWKELERQVLICGSASRLSRESSEKYFRSRPPGHQIGAWSSLQSNEIPNRQWMQDRESELTKKFSGTDIPLPDFWGGYLVKPREIEFWQGRENRLHDRIMYRSCGKSWDKVRLSP
ncbi:MAG: pyridoxamine 5'-phosphate oxidase [Verrucomicrobiaceae bacterium]|nr:pyridoxamine 5'-phosphate oxidase [Verrucomicrobiaceae bacterium]